MLQLDCGVMLRMWCHIFIWHKVGSIITDVRKIYDLPIKKKSDGVYKMGGNLIRREGTGNGDWIFLSLKCTSIHLQEISRWYTRTKKWYHYHHGTLFFSMSYLLRQWMEAYTSLWSYLLLYFGYYLGQCLSAKRLHPLSSRCWPLSNLDFPSPRYRKWKNLLSMGGNSSTIVLPVAGKPTEIMRKTLVYNDYFHLHIFCFS